MEINKVSLAPQLENPAIVTVFKDQNAARNRSTILDNHFFKSLDYPKRQYLNEIFKLMKLLPLAPASKATSERIISALKSKKTYLGQKYFPTY